MNQIISKIRRQNKIIGVVAVAIILAIFGVFLFISKKIQNGPEQEYFRNYITKSDTIQNKYNGIQKIELHSYKVTKNFGKSSSTGIFAFKVFGREKTGIEEIVWEEEDGAEMEIKSITEIHEPGIKEVLNDIKELFTGNKTVESRRPQQ